MAAQEQARARAPPRTPTHLLLDQPDALAATTLAALDVAPDRLREAAGAALPLGAARCPS